jgi:hypothetical protein
MRKNFVNYVSNYLIAILLAGHVSLLFSQTSPPPGTRTYGLEDNDRASQLLPLENGGYLFIGTLDNPETNSEDIWLVELDVTGEMIWQEIYGGDGADRGMRVIADSTAGYLLAGYTRSYGTGGFDAWLIKIDSSGRIEWQKTYGESLDDYALDVIPTKDGGYVVAGSTTDMLEEKDDLWVFNVDSEGNIGWETILGDFDHDKARSIKPTADGGYIVAGYTVQSLDSHYDLWLIKLDNEGDSLWSRTYGGDERDVAQWIQVTSDDNFLVMGYNESLHGNRDIWIIKTDSEGNIINSTTFGGEYGEYGHILNKTNDGNYIITGYTESFGALGWDLLMLKIDGNGDEIWSKKYGGMFEDFGHDIQQNQSGGYVCLGITGSYGSGGWDAWVLWTDSTGNIMPPISLESPYLYSITDIPTDQGGWVNVEFYRSLFDTDSLILPKVATAELYTVEINDGSGWMAVASTAAYGKSEYSVLVPTTRDSTSESDGFIDFRIIAAMEEGNFASNVVSGYSVDNLAPEVPSSVGGSVSEESEILISWQANKESDLKYYTVYRAQQGSPLEMMTQITETWYTDKEIMKDIIYAYSITATDHSGNESDKSDIVEFRITHLESISALPMTYYLSQNYPNPFNPETTIKYGLLNSGEVTIRVFDILGNLVTELLNQYQNKGHHQVIWNGKNNQNEQVSSGIYYYQLVTQKFQDIRKMVLVR